MNHILTERGGCINLTDPYVFVGADKADTITLELDQTWDDYEVSLYLGEFVTAWNGEALEIPAEVATKPGWIPVTITGVSGDKYRRTRVADRMLRAIGKPKEVWDK